ncbi:heme-binding-like protein At3g10130, chloroplastic isoform X4 [Lycium ferocissimum]|uniref:heme-binding-like protein At3g10130, chloroplastic isoform X4 n=1 Tax=Lycium ferocissimum TaxID=112874 RepID=UPI00281562EF|nr:heme-binding-like protein At3g10130, chloroplastic isoform X4 [Lycium ferocissimum]
MRWKYQLPEIHNLLSQAFCTFPQTDIQKERNKHCNSKMFLISPCSISAPPSTSRIRHSPIKSMAVNRSNSASQRINGIQSRISLLIALASQTSSLSQKLLTELAGETAKYVFPKRIIESRNLEEALMSVPDLETVKFNVLKRNDQYEIREVENTKKESMAMTTPVITRRTQSDGEKMEMTTPVITKRVEDQEKWRMSFVMPSKYGSDLPLPKDSSVTIKEVPRKTVAVVAFSGFMTDEEVKARESRLRTAVKGDAEFRVKDGALIEVAQYNPPFTLPFTRWNEISLEVEKKQE